MVGVKWRHLCMGILTRMWPDQTKMNHFHSWTPRFHQDNNTLTTTVFRKPTHTVNIYIGIVTTSSWPNTVFSTHCFQHIVFNTLAHRARVVSTHQQTLHKELEHIRKALQTCNFSPWTLNKQQQKIDHKHQQCIKCQGQPTYNNNNNNNRTSINKNISIVVPYIQGPRERYKRTCNNKDIQVHFKGTNTVKTLLMAPKDRDNKLQKSRVIYKFKCPHINCPKEYITGHLGTGLKTS